MNPPKFKKGDMVLVMADKISGFVITCPHGGEVGTVVKSYSSWGVWRYKLDCKLSCGCEDFAPIEPCLRLIRDGDLHITDDSEEFYEWPVSKAPINAELLIEITKWLEKYL